MQRIYNYFCPGAPTIQAKVAPLATIAERAITHPEMYSSEKLARKAAQLNPDDPVKTRLEIAAKNAELIKKVSTKSLPREADTTKYDLRQGSQNPVDFIGLLKQKGASLTSVELNYPTDDVFQALVDYCPNLTTLSYNTPGMNVGNYEVTDAGLLKVAQLKNLTSFRFCVDEMFGITSTGINELLSSDLFVNNIQHLYISLFLLYIDDASYPIFSTYKSLQTLYLSECNIVKSATLENNPLPATLTRFTFNQYPYEGLLTDKFLSILPQNLVSLNIGGSWKNVSAEGFQTMQARLSKLTQLALGGDAIPRALALSITAPLTALSLGNCSLLETTDFVTLTNNCPNLISYTIGKAPNFSNLVPLPGNLKSFSLDAPKLFSFTAVPTTLEELTLSHIKYDYTVFSSIAQMTSLHTLRIVKCIGFNDAAFLPILNAIKDRITTLELNSVSITLKGALEIAKCPKLQTLVLNRLYTFSADDLSTLLNNLNLRQRIVNLYIGMIELNDDNLGPILSSFTKLQVLFLMLNEFAVPKNFVLNPLTVGSFWLGPSQFYKFRQLQK